MILKEIYKQVVTSHKKRQMIAKAIIGKSFQADITTGCVNQSGNRSSIIVGDNCCIRGRLAVMGTGKIKIGDNCYIGGESLIGSVEDIVIGSSVIIANDTHVFDNNNHPTSPHKRLEMCKSGEYFGKLWSWEEAEHKRVIIEDNVWIGERCTILKGVVIGEGAVVGCNSVITKDVPPYTVVAGNPARVVKYLKREE